MAEAKRDQNDRPTALGVSSIDIKTPLLLAVDPVTGYLLVVVSTDSLSAVTPKHRIDQNDIPTSYGISNADGKTLIPIQTDANGKLLIQFT